MKTPICDFVQAYCQDNPIRFHMPGHKGHGYLGVEALDLTEIKGADALFEASSIIKESEINAATCFHSQLTLYSTEGSSLSIRTMIYLARQYALLKHRQPIIFAGRNAHKTFAYGCALNQMQVKWLFGGDHYLSCLPEPEIIQALLEEAKASQQLPAALFLTSPDYLGQIVKLQAISDICHHYDVLFMVDNAHGAYLHFLENPCHPLDLGADIVCDSAHKTLPVITGGAYLHFHSNATKYFDMDQEQLRQLAKRAMSIFASTSPSYLILQSLDYANHLLATSYPTAIQAIAKEVLSLKDRLIENGYELMGNEPLKLTILPKKKGYTGNELAQILRQATIECEMSDDDVLVCMITPETTHKDLLALEKSLINLEAKTPIVSYPPKVTSCPQAMSMHDALMSLAEEVDVQNSVGRILATPTVACPPAVPIVVCGEVISKEAVDVMQYYKIEKVCVVK